MFKKNKISSNQRARYFFLAFKIVLCSLTLFSICFPMEIFKVRSQEGDEILLYKDLLPRSFAIPEIALETPFSKKSLLLSKEIIEHYGRLKKEKIKFTKANLMQKVLVQNLNDITYKQANECISALEYFKIPKGVIAGVSEIFQKHLGATTGEALNKVVLENMNTIDHNQLLPPDPTKIPWHEFLKKTVEKQLAPSPDYKRTMALNFLELSKKYHVYPPVVDEQTWKDLEFFCGRSDRAQYFAGKVARTVTEMGKVFFFRSITECESDYDTLQLKKQRLESLIDTAHFDTLEIAFKELAEAENGIFSFWDPNDEFEVLSKNNLKLEVPVISFFKCIQNKLDKTKNPVFLEVYERYKDICNVLAIVPLADVATTIINLITPTFFGPLKVITSIGAIASSIVQIPQLLNDEKGQLYFKTCLLLKLVYLRDYLSALNTIRETLIKIKKEDGNNATLFDHFIMQLNPEYLTVEMRKLIEILKKPTFKQPKSFPKSPIRKMLTCLRGNVIAAYKIMIEHKQELVGMITAASELDALMSVVRLYKSHEGLNVGYCLPNYTEAKQPQLSIENSWNPSVDPGRAVGNDLVLGIDPQPRNALITGPNTAGKSTITKGIVQAVILAQSIGISPASEFEFTPMVKIMTDLNVIDNQAGQISLFANEIKRAYGVYDTLQKLPEGSFGLTFFDELFKGTAPTEGQVAANTLLKSLANKSNVITLATTHFDSLKELNEKFGFVQYRVTAKKRGYGEYHYPRKLEKGFSNQCIAFDLLKESGFDDDFIKKAHESLKNLKRPTKETSEVIQILAKRLQLLDEGFYSIDENIIKDLLPLSKTGIGHAKDGSHVYLAQEENDKINQIFKGFQGDNKLLLPIDSHEDIARRIKERAPAVDYLLGWMRYYGQGVPVAPSKALGHFACAALSEDDWIKQGALFYLGKLYYEAPDELNNREYNFQKYRRAKNYFDLVLDLGQRNAWAMASAELYLGKMYYDGGKNEIAAYHFRSIIVTQELNELDNIEENVEALGDAYYYLGKTSINLGEYESAKYYFEKALDVKEKSKEINSAQIGVIHFYLGRLIVQRMIMINKFNEGDKALEHLKRAKELLVDGLVKDDAPFICLLSYYKSVSKDKDYFAKAVRQFAEANRLSKNTLKMVDTDLLMWWIPGEDYTKAQKSVIIAGKLIEATLERLYNKA
jgi:TPR repeat protein